MTADTAVTVLSGKYARSILITVMDIRTTGQKWRVHMIDEKRVLQVAKEYGMNPDRARKLLEDARSEPAIMQRIHKYELLMRERGDTNG